MPRDRAADVDMQNERYNSIPNSNKYGLEAWIDIQKLKCVAEALALDAGLCARKFCPS